VGALKELWQNESGWNNNAQNPSSTAYGIAQFLDSTWIGHGPKTADAGKQIQYGMEYIAGRADYGSPSRALAAWKGRSPHWYDEGGKVPMGRSVVQNDTGKPEALLTGEQWDLVGSLLSKEQGKTLNAGGGMHMTINHNEQITYDSRNDFGGAQFTVVSDDPDNMARKLEARQFRSRVAQTRSVRRG